MSESTTEIKEFEILGQKVRFKPDSKTEVEAQEIIDLLKQERDALPENLDDSRATLLIALKIAADKIKLQREFKDNINELQSSIDDAMGFIDKFSIAQDEVSTLSQ